MSVQTEIHQPDFITPSESYAILQTASQTARRFENHPFYLSDVTSGMMNDWLSGRELQTTDFDPWCEFVHERIEAGCAIQRVRIHEAPRTPYQEWMIQVSQPVVVAGEDQRYLTRPEATALGITANDGDWWLIDDTTLIEFHVDGDWNMLIEMTKDVERVAEAQRTWGLTFPRASPLKIA